MKTGGRAASTDPKKGTTGQGLATEAKQDTQITNQGTETVAPPFGTKIIGWLQSIWNEIRGQKNTLENNEENTFNINEKIIVDTDDDSIVVNQVLPTNINLLYGWEEQEGGVWERIHTDTEGRLKVQQDFQPLPIGAAKEAKQDIIVSKLTGAQRPIDLVEATVNGSTTAGVQSVSLIFLGANGTLDGVTVPDRYTVSFTPNKGEDTVGSIAYEVPTTREQKILISYVGT